MCAQVLEERGGLQVTTPRPYGMHSSTCGGGGGTTTGPTTTQYNPIKRGGMGRSPPQVDGAARGAALQALPSRTHSSLSLIHISEPTRLDVI
eukprot:6666411-Prorocentrum_lima.AAC.1